MYLVNGKILKNRYDVIVVGAGLGGLTAASLLANRGLSVLLIDQQDKPGGACTSFKREDHVFDAGAAMLYGFGDKGFKPFRFILNELGEDIQVIAHKTLARMTFEGRQIIFWPDVERFIEELGALYPGETEGLRAFYADLYKKYENIVIKNEVISPPSEFSPKQGLRRLLSAPLAILQMQRLLNTSTREILEKYFKSPEIIHFFDKLCSAYAYTTASETPAVLAATMFLDNHIGGVYFPAGGAQMLPNVMERSFERHAGQVLYRHLVDEILIENGKAVGVRLQDGTQIFAERVVANATVWNIYRKLIRPEHSTPQRRAWAESLVPTFPSMTLYMVVDRQAIPEGTYPWEIFIENRQEIDSSDLTLYINSLVDATLCPPDELVVMAISPNLGKWPSPGDPAYQSAAYEEMKQQDAQKMIEQIDRYIPGLSKHIKTLVIGSPTTIERYLLKNKGAVGGPKNQIGQEMLKRLHARSEWKNLYFCGDSTVMGTGAPAAAVSGVGAANVILRDLHLPEYDSRKFPEQHVHFVETPYHRPAIAEGEISAANIRGIASQCQWCESPNCVADCPAGILIPDVMRRLEAQNVIGAARELLRNNPFGSLCGQTCPAEQLCERRCFRRGFSGKAVRIGETMRWLSGASAEVEWQPAQADLKKGKALILGGGLNGMSCAYTLGLAGYEVDVYGETPQPLQDIGVLNSELETVVHSGVRYHALSEMDLERLSASAREYRVVYRSSKKWEKITLPVTARVESVPEALEIRKPVSAELIAEGRRAAFALAAE